jgi:lysyl-tRNA synthetase class 2
MIREEADRRARLQSMIDGGEPPYPSEVNRTHALKSILDAFDEFEKEAEEVTVAGRVIALRDIGALSFIKLMDESATMQIVLRKADLENYKTLIGNTDVGDFYEVTGTAFVTKTGEKSVLSKSARIISKAVKPLPEKWHGLQDVETRYRQRELDLISNEEVRKRFLVRSKFVSAMRHYLDDHGFLEVETPILQPIPGGANARPFITHHNALGADFYLRIAPELYLKRLVVGGFEKIYEIGRCFRNEGIDYSHNPEFTMMELYWAYAKKDEFIDFLEDLTTTIIRESVGSLAVAYGEGEIDFSSPWPRMTFREAILNDCGIDIDTLKSPKEVIAAAKTKKLVIDFKGCVGLGEHLDELWKKTAREKIAKPTWIFDYPVELKPLAKATEGDPSKSATVQLVVQGAEIVNAYYYELNDPIDQRVRFEAQQELKEQGSQEAQWMDEAFLSALEHGMPPASGVGIGIDRLVAFITNSPNLKEIILFPTLKPEQPSEKSEESV